MSINYDHDHDNEITLFGQVNFRNQGKRFGIKTDDRRRHMYIIGKTGMGKTTLMENIILADIYAGHGCCYIDPHGDTAEKLIDFIPSHRINDVVYYNPADTAYPMGFNILEIESEDQKPLVASGLMGVFKKIWPDVWSARMEHILNNCVLALLDYPGSTLLGINRLLVDKDYRTRVIAKIRDPLVKTFWVAEFASWTEKYATEAIAPVQNKVGQFLSSFVIRNIVAQVKSTIAIREVMDEGKILIVNLSKGRIGEDNMRLLGGMLITKIQLAAQERQNTRESERRDFYLYVDEFQNFANESFAAILSEARKYRLNLIVAHQYIEQLDEQVAAAIFGNVGTLISMRVGAKDAEFLEPEYAPTFVIEDLVNLAKYQMYLKLMVDGVATPPFSANSLPPIAKRMGSQDKVVNVSRERYAEPRQVIEDKVLKWSGMELVVQQDFMSNIVPEQEVEPLGPTTLTEPPSSLEYPLIKTEEEKVSESETGEQEEEKEEKEYLRINPERLAVITATALAAQSQQQKRKKEKPKFAHTCTRCGKVWYLPMQLDPSRPMYCPECRPLVADERTQKSSQIRVFKRNPLPPETIVSGVEQSEASFAPKNQAPVPQSGNRPRIVSSDQRSALNDSSRPSQRFLSGEDLGNDLLEEILESKKQPVELNKTILERRAGEALPPRKEPRFSNRLRPRTGKSSSGLSANRVPPVPPPIPPRASSSSSGQAPSTGKPVAPGERITFEE